MVINAIKTVYKAREGNGMIQYFRTKQEPHTYFSAYPVSTDRSESFDVRVFWVFKPVGRDEPFNLESNEIPKNFEPCSPFEAISSVF